MTRVRGLAGLAVASAVLLTGCGSVPDFNPGIAARVGDETVSTRHVADLAADYCDAAASQLKGQKLPRSYLNGQVASSLALRSAADQLMAARGVEIDPSYTAAVKQAEGQLSTLSPAERNAIVEVQGSQVYVAAAETAVGKEALGGSPSAQEAQAAGEKEFVAWIDDHGLRMNPRYGVAIDKGQAVLSDTGLSYPLSGTAKTASAKTPDSAYAGALPQTQRCG